MFVLLLLASLWFEYGGSKECVIVFSAQRKDISPHTVLYVLVFLVQHGKPHSTVRKTGLILPNT